MINYYPMRYKNGDIFKIYLQSNRKTTRFLRRYLHEKD